MATLDSCKRELASIIQELESIKWGIGHEFKGIGQEKCVTCIEKAIERYQGAKRSLDKVNTNRLADWILGDG